MGKLYDRFIRLPVRRTAMACALARRRACRHTQFVAVTGSSGKTTAKNMMVAVLAAKGSVKSSRGSRNAMGEMVRTIMAVRGSHAFCVMEMGDGRVGSIRSLAEIFLPDISVITCVNREHYGTFRSMEAVALEKGALVKALRPSGWAVLNRDDPSCVAMANDTEARILFFGLDENADLRATRISAAWPDRLLFTATYRGESAEVRTRLAGKFWVTSALAAIGAGLAAGVKLSDAAAALESVTPFDGRMSIHEHEGMTFIRDDWKNPEWSLPATFDFMREARAARRILVLGHISDTPRRPSQLYPRALAEARRVSDIVLLTGSWAAKLKPGLTDGVTAVALETLRDVHDWLKANAQPGDLILLRGNSTIDHMERIVHDREKPIACWRQDCRIIWRCHECRHLYRG